MALLIWLDLLQGGYWRDERHFWETSLSFSDRILPTLEQLRNYEELNTPLPFIIFGALEYLFQQGIFLGRLLNLGLSLAISLIIGWPKPGKPYALFCLIGLWLCPYYFWLSGRLYTELITCFWIVLGLMAYIRDRTFLSGIAFILAIASRQYALAFPLAIFTYEFGLAMKTAIASSQIRLADQWKWLAPLVAVLSIGVWLYLFQGLAPETAIEIRATPEVQQTFWAVRPGQVVNFMAFTGLYVVIPENLIFIGLLRQNQFAMPIRKGIGVAIALLVYVLIFPPSLVGDGPLMKVIALLPQGAIAVAVLYGLALIACLRFSRLNLITLIWLFNCLIMIKAFPLDRYVLLFAVAFWYLKSIGWADDQNQRLESKS
ncbi:MAG: hypothetical protein ACTS2F_10485 [Thainema sp.]